MRSAKVVLLAWAMLVWPVVAIAQSVYVQLEAHPNQAEAEQAARGYAASLDRVNGFRFSTGWYVVALGPYELNAAVQQMNQLKSQRRIPADSYLVDQNAYSNQFFASASSSVAAPEVSATPQPEPEVPDETQNQALRSERQLTRQQKFDLQIALQWFGYYNGAIDAAFGRGTRRSMAAWQESKGIEPRGVLTTRQRAQLLAEYQEVLASIGLAELTDDRAGITVQIPAAMVQFDRHDPPFAHYEPVDDSGVKVLLISRTGDESGLIGLYDIMQTLEIVPREGERTRRANSFTLTGENARIKSHTYAELANGEIKGFTLLWPAGEDRRFDVTLRAMQESFASQPGVVLPDVLGEGAMEQSLDLMSGLQIRRPTRSASGFYISSNGAVLTSASAVAGCTRVTLDEVFDAEVTAMDLNLGVALLKPKDALAPIDYARFQPGVPRLQSEIAIAGYSFGGRLSAPSLTFGTLSELRGLSGEEGVKRLAINATESDAGGPVFDASGAVLGMLLPQAEAAGKRLPGDVAFASSARALTDFLAANGAQAIPTDRTTAISPEQLTRQAADLTVLVGCWSE